MVILHLAIQVTICGSLILFGTRIGQLAKVGRHSRRQATFHYEVLLGFLTIVWAFAFFWLISAHLFFLFTGKPLANVPFPYDPFAALQEPFAFPAILLLRFFCLLGLLAGWRALRLRTKRETFIG